MVTVAGEILDEEGQAWPTDLAALQDQDKSGQQEPEPAGEAQGDPEGDAVELRERAFQSFRQALGRERSLFVDRLVIFPLGVHTPQVVALAEHRVPDGEQSGEHRVILVVVPMQSVPSDGLKILEGSEESPNDAEVLTIARIVDRVGFGDAHHASVFDILVAHEPNPSDFAPAEVDQLGVGRGPQVVTLHAEILKAEGRLPGIRDHVRAPVPEVLDPPTATSGECT